MAEPPAKEHSNQKRDAEFVRIVDEHARLLYRVAHSVLHHRQDAEDAVQDALLKLYRGESWRRMEDERAFLARVVWRVALDRRMTRRDNVAHEGAELELKDARPSPENALAESDAQGLLLQWMAELSDELRLPLELSAMEELTSREIGVVMGLPEGTVRTRLMRARHVLKAKYEAMTAAGREVAAGERSRR